MGTAGNATGLVHRAPSQPSRQVHCLGEVQVPWRQSEQQTATNTCRTSGNQPIVLSIMLAMIPYPGHISLLPNHHHMCMCWVQCTLHASKPQHTALKDQEQHTMLSPCSESRGYNVARSPLSHVCPLHPSSQLQ